MFQLLPTRLRCALIRSTIAGATIAALTSPAYANHAVRASASAQPLPASLNARIAGSIANGSLPVVYVSQPEFGAVLAYPSTQSAAPTAPIEAIPNLHNPTGLAVDANNNLYVVEEKPSDVKVFHPGTSMPFKTLVPASTASPLYVEVAVDARGTVYVSNALGGIDVFANGSTSPSYTLSNPAISSSQFVAVDALGNIILTYNGPNPAGGQILQAGVFPAATSVGSTSAFPFFLPLALGQGNFGAFPETVTVDKNGNLVASYLGSVVGFAAGTQKPAFSFPIIASGEGYSRLALSGPNDLHLFIAAQITATLDRYAYPSGRLEQHIPLPAMSSVPGIATSPPSPLGTY